MAIQLSSKPNTDAPSATYPFGNIRDDDGSSNGTPVNTVVYGDFHQFFEALMNTASIAFNGLPENAVNGYQYLLALAAYVRLVTASETASGTAEIATQTETNTGTDDLRIVTPLKLHTYLGAWVSRSNVADVVVTGGTGTTVTDCNIKYKIVGKTMTMVFFFSVSNTTAPTSFALTIPDSKSSNVGFAFNFAPIFFDSTTQKAGRGVIGIGGTAIQLFLSTGLTFTNTQVSQVTGQVSFEIA